MCKGKVVYGLSRAKILDVAVLMRSEPSSEGVCRYPVPLYRPFAVLVKNDMKKFAEKSLTRCAVWYNVLLRKIGSSVTSDLAYLKK